ncbi:MAG: dynamin family protein [Lachnospiraceae bacterium]|nr:dynamin family protein [Ruminococcus sp.]MCM1274657.1 dynamin family protein [Lachnospiraceae bacterium]
MFDCLYVDERKVYPTLVVSTMSSGKSTLINALAGKELMPSKNRACTAKSAAILDNDMQDEFVIHAVNSDGKYTLIEHADQKAVAKFNDTNEVLEMIIEGDIKGVKNSTKAMLLIDTPGINNCLDTSHSDITEQTLREFDEGLILYIINAQQIGTYDDELFLKRIAAKLKECPMFGVIFVINKMDTVDPQKEPLDGVVENCRRYIEGKGIKEPLIIPVSSSAALLFKKVIGGEKLSEKNEDEFALYYRCFKNDCFSLTNYIRDPELGDMNEVFEVDGTKYTKAALYGALRNTGFLALEAAIDSALVSSLEMKAPKIKFNKSQPNGNNPPATVEETTAAGKKRTQATAKARSAKTTKKIKKRKKKR